MTAPVRAAKQIFADEIGRANADLDLAGAALSIAQEHCPESDELLAGENP